MRNNIAPGMTVMPSRMESSLTTPLTGASSVMRGRVLPSASIALTVDSGIPNKINR